MDAARWVDRLLDDEGLTDGLADVEAKLLVEWTIKMVTAAVEGETDAKSADALAGTWAAKARRIAKITGKLCYEKDLSAAQGLWTAAGHSESLQPLAQAKPLDVVNQLCAWEAHING